MRTIVLGIGNPFFLNYSALIIQLTDFLRDSLAPLI